MESATVFGWAETTKGTQPRRATPTPWLVSFIIAMVTGCESASTTNTTAEPKVRPTSASSAPVDSIDPETGDDEPATTLNDDHDQANPSPSTISSAQDDTSPIEIAFEDIQLPIQADVVFRPFMLTERARELDGKRIRIHGYMLPDTKTKGITQFVLLKNTECKFGPGGQADHLLNVMMVEGESARFQDDPVTVEGVLTINPFKGPDGNTWSIYDLACERVERYRPRR